MDERPKVLVVDDELPVCKSVAKALSESFAVETALSAEEALEKQKSAQYRVIVTDLMMPGLSGMDLLRKVTETGTTTRVVMITGYPSIRSAVQSIKLGAFDYIPKPFTPQEIRGLVARAAAGGKPRKTERVAEQKETASPAGLYSITGNSWAKIEEDGRVRVGVHADFLGALPGLASVEIPKVSETRYQGEVCARLTDSNGNVHRVWTPVSGKVVAVNGEITVRPRLLLEDPYGDGWIFVLEPMHLEEDLKNLTSQVRSQ
jgi:FixJ family two-component response regulator/glycine cleavage system H lipoate-binding protein